MGELLQELRVAGIGVQVLFGFLLSLPFSVRFTKLTGSQRDLYVAALLLAALSAALLTAPVGAPVAVLTVMTACTFAGLWFALPLGARRAGDRPDQRGITQTGITEYGERGTMTRP